MLPTPASGSGPEEPVRDPDAVADEALVDAYRRLPPDSDLIRSARYLAAVTVSEW